MHRRSEPCRDYAEAMLALRMHGRPAHSKLGKAADKNTMTKQFSASADLPGSNAVREPCFAMGSGTE